MSEPVRVSIPPGLVVMTTHGSVTQETAECLMRTIQYNEKNGVTNLTYTMMPGGLVDKARNDACRRMLSHRFPDGNVLQFLIFIDADMTWGENALQRLLVTAYHTHTWADVVGAYCSLRGELALPTIDTGTGTWETHYPQSGVLEVMRTGGAFLLVKRQVCERIPDPWFAMRVPARPIDFMAEVDNYARIKFDGSNPFVGLPGDPWEKLQKIASIDPSVVPTNFTPIEVGEDSGFCDRVKFHGMRIVVDTDIITGHVSRIVYDWRDHQKAMTERDRNIRLAMGIGTT